jgi:CheY-like chemotaxis protein
MDMETKERIFEPFFTTKELGKGTGLGLATVYGIIKQHGGDIQVDSEPGEGTRFRMYFPASGETIERNEGSLWPAVENSGVESILLVEDNPEVRDLAVHILRRRGYNIVSAENGAEAIEAQKSHNNPFDLLLTDVVMPGMSGKDLFERLSGVCPSLKVLYMSGHPSDIITHCGLLAEEVNFIEKPFTMNALTAKVRDVLDSE